MASRWPLHVLATLPPRKRLSIRYEEGWVALGTWLEGGGTSRPRRGSTTWTIQSVASRYTDCIFPASNWEQISKKSLHGEWAG
jgi:hypothetical protein